MRKISFLCLSFLFFIANVSTALEQETYVPPSTLFIKTSLEFIPTYDLAYDSKGEGITLREFLIRDKFIRERIDGDLQRRETQISTEMIYGFSENLLFTGDISVHQRTQSSDLSIKPFTGLESNPTQEANIRKTVENLESKTANGLGDLRMRAVYVFSKNMFSIYRGSIGLQLPTGTDGTPHGVYPIEIGSRAPQILTTLQYTYFPTIPGLSHHFRTEFEGRLKGKRKTLTGEEVTFFPGNGMDFQYHLSYERQNWYLSGGWEHQIEFGSKIGKLDASNGGFLDLAHFSLGYGNLSSLEEAPQTLPYQFRLGAVTPFNGSNAIYKNNIQVTGVFYF